MNAPRAGVLVVIGVGLALVCAACQNPSKANDASSSKKRRPAQPDLADPSGQPAGSAAASVELTIGNEVITVDDVLQPLRQPLASRQQAGSPEEDRRELHSMVLEAVRYQIDEVLLYQEASADLTEREEEWLQNYVDQVIRDRVQKDHGGRQATYEQALVKEGTTLQDAREKTRRELVIQRYLGTKVYSKVGDPTRAELLSYFESVKAELTIDERRELFLIEASIEPSNSSGGKVDDAVRAARSRIEAARDELRSGAPFANVAASYSQGLHASEGGAWNWVTRKGLRPRWQPAVDTLFTLSEGETSDIIAGEQAFFIVKCGRIESAREPDFKAIQPELQERYRRSQQRLLLDEALTKLRERKSIDPERVRPFLEAVLSAAASMETMSEPRP